MLTTEEEEEEEELVVSITKRLLSSEVVTTIVAVAVWEEEEDRPYHHHHHQEERYHRQHPRDAKQKQNRIKSNHQHLEKEQEEEKINDDVKGKLDIFMTIEPEGVNELEITGEWEEIELAVDSGATETVVGEGDLLSIETKEGPASKRGTEYEVANGVRIPNLGEKKFTAHTEEGGVRTLTAQVCDVNKPLLSVKKVIKGRNRVVIDEDGSYIESKVTGERTWLREQGGLFML